MAVASTTLAHALLNHVLRGTPYTPPASVKVALYITPTSDTGGGTEVSGTGYARQTVTFGVAGAVQTRRSANDGMVDFGIAGSDWGNITHIGLHDGVTGDLLFHAPLAGAKRAYTGDPVTVPVGALSTGFL